MSVRAKFKVETKGEGVSGKLVLRPVYSSDPNHENKSFWDATPNGVIEMYITNPIAFAKFQIGSEYYIDFTKAE
jgi:hypothetical protein